MSIRAGWLSAAVVAIAVALATCVDKNRTKSSDSVAVPGPSGEHDEAPASSRARACPIAEPTAIERPLGALIALGEWRGTSWAIARASIDGGFQPVLLHLDSHGNLIESEVPALTEYAAFEAPGRLHFADFGTKTLSWSVDVTNPDAVLPIRTGSTAPSLLSLADGGYDTGARVKAFAVSGGRALVSVYRHHPLGDGKFEAFGDTALYERQSLARRSAAFPYTTWKAECGSARCVGIATPNDDSKVALLVELDEQGEKRERLGSWGCSGWPDWRNGSKWTLVWLEDGKLNALSYDLSTGEKRRGSTPARPSRECEPLLAMEIGGRRGVAFGKPPSFVPLGDDMRFGKPEPIPESTERSRLVAPLPDGALVIDYTADRAMVHAPTHSRGSRRYHTEWSFAGKSAFLRRGARGFTLTDEHPLPKSGTEGVFGDGAHVTALVRGAFGAAIVSAGYRASFVLLSKPCD